VGHELVLESSLIGAVPGRLKEDAELLSRFRQLLLQREEVVLSGVPYRGPSRGQDDREAQREERSRGVAREVEVAANQHPSGFAQKKDRRAFAVRVHAHRAGIRTNELVVAEDEIRSARDTSGVIGVRRHLETERLAVLAGIGGTRGVRRYEQ